MTQPTVFFVPLIDTVNLPEPDPIFAPESEEQKQFYFKLAEIANKKARKTFFALFLVIVSLASLTWTSGTTIYLCFEADGSSPPVYKEIDINICKVANDGKLTVARKFDASLLNDPYLHFASAGLATAIFLLVLKSQSTIAIKLLAYGVKANCNYSYQFFYGLLGMLFGVLICQSIYFQSLIHLTDIGNQKLYYWRTNNYPETFMGHSLEFLKSFLPLIGMIKILLMAVSDPLGFFCSLSDFFEASPSSNSNLQHPQINYVTDTKLVIQVKFLFKIENAAAEDYLYQQILTALLEKDLLFPYDPNESKELGTIEKIFHIIGSRSYGFEKEVRNLTRKASLTQEEFEKLLTTCRKLILHSQTKIWFQTLVFCSYCIFVTGMIVFYVTEDSYWQRLWRNLIFILSFLMTTFLPVLIEYPFVCCILALSLLGSCTEASFVIIEMLRAKDRDNHYIISPYILIALCILQIFTLLKIWSIIRLLQKAKNLLLQSLNSIDNPELAYHLNSS